MKIITSLTVFKLRETTENKQLYGGIDEYIHKITLLFIIHFPRNSSNSSLLIELSFSLSIEYLQGFGYKIKIPSRNQHIKIIRMIRYNFRVHSQVNGLMILHELDSSFCIEIRIKVRYTISSAFIRNIFYEMRALIQFAKFTKPTDTYTESLRKFTGKMLWLRTF